MTVTHYDALHCALLRLSRRPPNERDTQGRVRNLWVANNCRYLLFIVGMSFYVEIGHRQVIPVRGSKAEGCGFSTDVQRAAKRPIGYWGDKAQSRAGELSASAVNSLNRSSLGGIA